MRRVVVTGASAGIGRATAKALAERGDRVWLVGRNAQRTEESAAQIRSLTGNAHVHHALADFSSLASVRELAAQLRDEVGPLDVLINNAGVWHQSRRSSHDGFEDTFAVNHLAPFLLTHLLIPALRAAPRPARVVFVSSILHRNVGAFDFDDLDVERNPYDGLRVYGRSKLANVLCANEFARRLRPHGITSNSVHPGNVQTSIVRDSAFLRIGIRLARPFIRTAEEGARTSVYVASHPALERISGAYFSNERQVPPSAHARDRSAAEMLWSISEERVGLA